MSYTYPPTHQPSAVYYSPPPVEDGAGTKGMVNLSDECPICYEDFRTLAVGDKHTYRQLAKTECNHFFHRFCLNQHLTNGLNTDCPSCRKSALIYTTIDLDLVPPQPQVLKPSVVQPQNNEAGLEFPVEEVINVGGAILSGLGSLAYATLMLGGSVLYHGVSAVASSLSESKQQFDQRVQNFFLKSEKSLMNIPSVQRRNQEDMTLLMASIKSIPEDKLYKARASFDRIEVAYTNFEKSLLDNQNRLKQAVNDELAELSR